MMATAGRERAEAEAFVDQTLGRGAMKKAMIGLGATAAVGAAAYLGLVTGAVPVDVGVGRRTRPLGPHSIEIAAPRETVFDVIAAPYLGRTPKAMQDKIRVLERGSDMVLAAHYTPVRGRLVATTVETVRFTRPERVDLRLVRGPVPQVTETFELSADGDRTRLAYSGELGTDFGALGACWGNAVASAWEQVVASSFESIRTEAERRTGAEGTSQTHGSYGLPS